MNLELLVEEQPPKVSEADSFAIRALNNSVIQETTDEDSKDESASHYTEDEEKEMENVDDPSPINSERSLSQ